MQTHIAGIPRRVLESIERIDGRLKRTSAQSASLFNRFFVLFCFFPVQTKGPRENIKEEDKKKKKSSDNIQTPCA